MGWDRELAEDAVQDVWVSVWKRRRKFKGEHGPASLHRFLNVSTVNQCRSFSRSLVARRKREAKKAHPPDAPSPDESSRDLQQQETALLIRQAIEKLRPKDRQVLVLYHLESWPIDTIAESLNVTENACKVRLTRARAKLKEHLPNHLTEDLP